MIVLPIKARVLLGLYLLIVATLAVGIHIQMTNAGVRYPQWVDQPIWVPLSLFILQNMGILWLGERIKEWKTSLSFTGQWAVLFITMAALQELLIRLPLTAGYTVDQQFLYLWVSNYLPELLLTLMTTGVINVISRTLMLNNKVIAVLVVIIFTVLSLFFIQPVFQDITQPLMPYLTSPDSAGVLEVPYPWQVDVIASLTFIEPVIASFFVCYLIYFNHYSRYKNLMVQTILTLLILTESGVTFVFYLYYSSIESYVDRILSISQFTLEWVFIGVAVSTAIVYLTRKQRSGRISPAW